MIYAITLILLVLSTLLPAAFAPAPVAAPSDGGPSSCDPALTQLFTPRRPVWGRYEVCASIEPLRPAAADGFTYTAPERLEALDAFGTAGEYDRSRLAQLYGGRRVEVIRGWKKTPEHFESVIRLSPYPDATLTRLNEGTMTVRWIAELASGELVAGSW
jgi:hypothetical protein